VSVPSQHSQKSALQEFDIANEVAS